jgi:hypothetical protein
LNDAIAAGGAGLRKNPRVRKRFELAVRVQQIDIAAGSFRIGRDDRPACLSDLGLAVPQPLLLSLALHQRRKRMLDVGACLHVASSLGL